MTRKDYTQEFKEQILRESQEVGNVSLVARRHNISPNTIHTWRRKAKKIGSTKPLPEDEAKRIKELEARLAKIRVVGEDGHTISLLKAAARALIYLLPAVLTTYGVYFPVVIPNTELVVPYLALLGNVICIFTVIVFLFNTQARQTVL